MKLRSPINISRRQRSNCSVEYHNYSYGEVKHRYINLVIGHPRYHAWWAFSLYVYLPNRKHRIVVPGFRKEVKLV